MSKHWTDRSIHLERIGQARQETIERIFSRQTDTGYWVSSRITDPRSSNVDGTALMLVDLLTVPELSRDRRVRRGIAHLISNQNPDRGWSDLSDEPSRPTVTSYVLWALGRSDVGGSPEVRKGVHWLEEAQCEDGGWAEIAERPWEGGIRPGETQPWITASCIRALHGCPQSRMTVIRKALSYLEEAQRSNGSWEGRMGNDIVLLSLGEARLTVQREMVRRGVDHELSFQRPDGFLPDAWEGETLMHMVRGLGKFIKLGVPIDDERIARMIGYLERRKKDLGEQLDIYADLGIFRILEDLSEDYGIPLLS